MRPYIKLCKAGRWYRRNHLTAYESAPPNIPVMEQFGDASLQKLKVTRVKPIRPIWQSRRIPLMAMKIGCMNLWDEWGLRHPVTVLKVDRLRVLEQHTISKHGQEGLKLGFGHQPVEESNKAKVGEIMKAGMAVKQVVKARRCSSDSLLPVGHTFSVRHFVPGQWVMIAARSRHRGFQGT